MSSKRKSEIEQDLRNDDKRYSLFTPTSVRSSVWKHFQVIKFLDNVENFARCNHCAEILSYAPRSGTGSLLRHRCVRVRSISSPKNVQPAQSVSNFIRCMLPKKTKEDILKSQLEFILKDLKSLSTTEGDGFRKFAQALINIGAEYGKQNVDEILVSRSILINSLIPAEYFNTKNQLEYILTNNHISFSTSVWVDERSRRSFFSLTGHFINDEFVMCSSLLGTREFTSLTKETSDRLHYFVMDILNEFQIKEKFGQSVIVTDNLPQFIDAFRCYKQVSCICHNINLFMKEVLENVNIKEIQDLIEASKSLVHFFESSELNNIISLSINQNGTERFSSVFGALQNIFNVYNEIEQALIERNEWQEIAGVNFHLLDCVVSFFKPFKECFDLVSTQTTPVITEYCFWYQKLQATCLEGPLDSKVITELKATAMDVFERIMKPDILHYIALFLNPRKGIKSVLSENKLKQTENAVKELIVNLKKQQDRDLIGLLQTDADCPDISVVPGMFNSEECEKEIDNEIIRYLKIDVEHFNVLQFWKNSVDFPILKNICRQILSIPTSCTKCTQGIFSLDGILEGDRSNANIPCESIDQLLFLHNNTGYVKIKDEGNSAEA
ncbi:uncharacterized protein LOC101450468 [Ceratitis capitata]|uniref:Transposable element Hobo transposase n=1 Tax=Ceratitis capitata TaxID=7213 RepID=W8BIV9_CERCA|nr:uncharacterized protein LOC101450468 [Ceratitis capitata]